jgi:phosphoglycolate phosphatase-like HAD superfamily hydrolase
VWAFDVDGTVIDSLTGTSVRPGTVELLTHLRRQRCTTVLWSAAGADYAEQRADELGMRPLFDAFLGKDERSADGRYRADHLAPDPGMVVFVDDRPEDVPAGAEVVRVSPYLAPNPHDHGLAVAARRAGIEDA